jgi:hypothetical protein
MNGTRMWSTILGAVFAYAVVRSWPELVRYKRLRQM